MPVGRPFQDGLKAAGGQSGEGQLHAALRIEAQGQAAVEALAAGAVEEYAAAHVRGQGLGEAQAAGSQIALHPRPRIAQLLAVAAAVELLLVIDVAGVVFLGHQAVVEAGAPDEYEYDRADEAAVKNSDAVTPVECHTK